MLKKFTNSNDSFAQWFELTGGQPFILDLGFTPGAVQSLTDGSTHKLERYAVFMPIPKQRRHHIVEVGADCGGLQEKYNVPDDLVVRVAQKSST